MATNCRSPRGSDTPFSAWKTTSPVRYTFWMSVISMTARAVRTSRVTSGFGRVGHSRAAALAG